MIFAIRSILNIGSGILSVLVYVTLLIELISMLSMTSFQVFDDVHYFIFLLLFLDSVVRLIIRPAKSFGYKRLFLGLLSILPVLNYHGFLCFIELNLGIQQGILLIIAVTRIQHLSFYLNLCVPIQPNHLWVGLFCLFYWGRCF